MPERKTKPRKGRATKPIKIAALIITAIQNLRETRGSTPGKIVDYITLASELPQGRIKPQVKAALKRAIEYGILKRFRGHYFLPTGDDLDRADKVATRFATLPTPVPSRTTCKAIGPKRFSMKKSVKARPAKKLKKNIRKAWSMPLSLTSMTTQKSDYREEQ